MAEEKPPIPPPIGAISVEVDERWMGEWVAYGFVEMARASPTTQSSTATSKEVNQMFQTPDITPAQIIAVVGAVLGVARRWPPARQGCRTR